MVEINNWAKDNPEKHESIRKETGTKSKLNPSLKSIKRQESDEDRRDQALEDKFDLKHEGG